MQVEIEQAVDQQAQAANGRAETQPGDDIAFLSQAGAEVLAGLDKEKRQGSDDQNAADDAGFRQGFRIIVVGMLNSLVAGHALKWGIPSLESSHANAEETMRAKNPQAFRRHGHATRQNGG